MLIGKLVNALAGAHLLKETPGTKELRLKLGIGMVRMESLIKEAINLELVEANMRGKKPCGWRLTEKGKRFHDGGES